MIWEISSLLGEVLPQSLKEEQWQKRAVRVMAKPQVERGQLEKPAKRERERAKK